MKGSMDKDQIGFDLIIIDAMNFCRKFDWVMRNLCDSKGRKTGVIYGVVNFIKSM